MARPDPDAPDTLGWRVWAWDVASQRLISPTFNTVWHTAELRVENWNSSEALRGVAGIHAARLPLDWRRADIMDHGGLGLYGHRQNKVIVGVVERFGKYVLGTEGWRAEIVIIRKLRAPSTEIGLKLEQAYPEVEVYYEDR
jgi:hypothetical protein